MEDLSKKREEVQELLSKLSTTMNHQNVIAKAILRGSYNPADVKHDEVLAAKLQELFSFEDEEINELLVNSEISTTGNTQSLMIRDILKTFEKIEDNSYFYEKAQETIGLLNLLLEAKTALYEILDYYMLNVDSHNYTFENNKLNLIASKFQQVKLKIVPREYEEDKVLYVATKPVNRGDINEFTQYIGDDDFFFQKYTKDATVKICNFVYDLSFGNYYVDIDGDWYPAFFSIDDIDGKIKPFYAGKGVIFNFMNV